MTILEFTYHGSKASRVAPVSDRPKPFDDQEQADLIEQSQRLVAEMDVLIERAKQLRQEHRSLTDKLKGLNKNKPRK